MKKFLEFEGSRKIATLLGTIPHHQLAGNTKAPHRMIVGGSELSNIQTVHLISISYSWLFLESRRSEKQVRSMVGS
jgi:hypothetical protein